MPDKKTKFQDKRDAVEALLEDKYGLTPDESKAMSNRLRRKGDEMGIQGEALSNRADIEKERMQRMTYYTDLMKRRAAGEKLEAHEEDYVNQVQDAVSNRLQSKAAAEQDYLRNSKLQAEDQVMQNETRRDMVADAQFVGQNRVQPTLQSSFMGGFDKTRPAFRTIQKPSAEEMFNIYRNMK